jgi:hypothetical protein
MIVAISQQTGELVEDKDVFATVARPRGSGSRNELCRRHLVAALGISKREWQDIIVGLIAPLSHDFGTLTAIDQHTAHLLPVRAGNPARWQGNGLETQKLRETRTGGCTTQAPPSSPQEGCGGLGRSLVSAET